MKQPTLCKKCPYSECFWSECGKIRTRKTPNTDTFHAVLPMRAVVTQKQPPGDILLNNCGEKFHKFQKKT